jgi:hypothetical protein
MRQLLARLTLALVIVCALGGCALFQSPNAAFVAGVDAGLNGGPSGADILNKYDRYVDADPTLTADTKKIEKTTTAKLRKLIANAKE